LKKILAASLRVRASIFARIFSLSGCKPWTRGYDEYRWSKIRAVLESGDFTSQIGKEGYGFRVDERVVEYPWLLSRLPASPLRLLDAGSALNFELLLTHDKLNNKEIFISTLAPEGVSYTNLGISYVYEDVRQTCFRDEFFDCIACISTLEHVGMDNTFIYTTDVTKAESDPSAYLEFIKSLYRILKPGGTLFLSVPFGKYKNHGWFQVFNAEMVDSLINAFAPSSWSETVFTYEEDRWMTSSRDAARLSECFDIHVEKQYFSDYLAFSRSVICLELRK
jgi:SAM-dependent methyltransferase